MKRLLIILAVMLSVVALFAAMSFTEKPMEKDKQMAMTMTVDPAMMAIYGLIRSVHGLGGDISVDGGAVSITLNLDAKQLEMLKKALEQPEPPIDVDAMALALSGGDVAVMKIMKEHDLQEQLTQEYSGQKSGRFLLGNKDGKGMPGGMCGSMGDMKAMQGMMQGGMCPMMQGKDGKSCGMKGDGGCKMMGKDGKCACCGDDCKMKQGGACDGKCACCKDGCKMMGDGGCKMMQGMMGKDGKGCGMMSKGGMCGMMSGMQGMPGGMGMMGMMGMMPPMDIEITGKCPKCGAEMNFMVKCKMMAPPMDGKAMGGMMMMPKPSAPPEPPKAPEAPKEAPAPPAGG